MADRHLYGNTYRPRLCHLRRRPDFVGYGFNLHCERNQAGQFIGKIDPGSPAEAAGLREGDRIVEVNFVCVEEEAHRDVVARIKEGVMRNNTRYADEVILLVVDSQTDDYYLNQALPINSSDPNVERINSDDQHAKDENSGTPPASPSALTKPSNSEYRNVTDFTGPNVVKTTITHTPPSDGTDGEDGEADYLQMSPPPTYVQRTSDSATASPARSPYTNIPGKQSNNSSTRPSAHASGGSSILEMSAAEYREQLKAKRAQKRDPRKDSQMPMKDKFDFINHM